MNQNDVHFLAPGMPFVVSFLVSKFIVSDTVISVDCCAAQWAAGECRRLDRHFRSFNVLEIC